jgi:hypothetical protein
MVSHYSGQTSSPLFSSLQHTHTSSSVRPSTTTRTALAWSSRKISLTTPPESTNWFDITTSIAPSLFPRSGFALSATTQGDFYIFGGDRCGGAEKNDLYYYSTAKSIATLIECYGDIPSPRFKPASALIHDIRLFVFGGLTTINGGWEYDDGLYCLNTSMALFLDSAYISQPLKPISVFVAP